MRSKLGSFFIRKGTIDFMFANYAYEWNVKSFVLKHYKNYDVFIDVGANIGTYSIMMAQEGLQCYGFEPVQDNYRAYYINVLLNRLQKKITPVNCALGDVEKDAEFYVDPVNTGASHITYEHKPDNVHVSICTLDSYLEQFNIPKDKRIMIKIDVEGMEPEVIRGGTRFFTEYPHMLIILESKHSEEDSIKNELDKLGTFRYMRVDAFNMASIKVYYKNEEENK
ncbi:MAG: FkbM family methyltransferase [Bacteroidales bacterium]|nr:FkbM family methyltransferase [Bacteroidales bacterium]